MSTPCSHTEFSTPLLLVDDNAINRELIIACLDGLPYAITIAENGAEALKHFNATQFGMVLMDVQMPVMDGLEATRQIRRIEQREHRPHTPIMGVTANASPADQAAGFDAGMDDFMAKPIRFKELVTRVERWTRLSPPSTASAA